MKGRLQALLDMGYNQLNNSEMWAKPMGYSYLTVNLKTNEWVQWFRSAADSELFVYTSDHFDIERWYAETDYRKFVDWIMSCEAWKYKDNVPIIPSLETGLSGFATRFRVSMESLNDNVVD